MAQAQVDIEDSSYVASCPWHAYDFNLDTGSSSYGVKACVFPVVVRDGTLVMQYDREDGATLSAFEPVSEKVKYKHGPRPTTQSSFPPAGDGAMPRKDASLCEWCVHVLQASDPERKIELTTQLFSLFASRELSASPMRIGAGTVEPPDEPLRPQDMRAVKPWEIPTLGKGGTLKSRINMLHSLANIEQWAIDLAIDICVRFAAFRTEACGGLDSRSLPRTFFYDWLKVANDEAKHFSLLRARLEELGSYFGALPVHHGLWESGKFQHTFSYVQDQV